MFLRSNKLKDADIAAISNAMKTNGTIKVLDISSNQDIGGPSLDSIGEILSGNRALEYMGLSKLNLTNEMVLPLFDLIGRFPFPEDQVEEQLKNLKARDAIVEKNKKLKSSKKPEEPVPQLDNIEQISRVTETGEEI